MIRHRILIHYIPKRYDSEESTFFNLFTAILISQNLMYNHIMIKS